jgi:ferrous iron transport protein B
LQSYHLDGYVYDLCDPFTAVLGLPAAVGVTLIFGIMRKELSLIMLTEALGTTQIAAVLSLTQLLEVTQARYIKSRLCAGAKPSHLG